MQSCIVQAGYEILNRCRARIYDDASPYGGVGSVIDDISLVRTSTSILRTDFSITII